MITHITKLKRSTVSKHTYFGQPIFIWLDKQDGVVMVSYSPDFEDVFPASILELKPVNQVRSTISSKPKVLNDKENTDKQLLDEFYIKMSLTMPYNCDNCSKPLYAFNKTAKRSVTCHLLPKSIFESIATDQQNIVFMGADYIGCPCNCHDRYDSNVDTRIKMPIYKVALERFETDLKFKLTPRELKQAFTYLNIEWK